MNVYEKLPSFENDEFALRGISVDDGKDLLKVYSDEKAVALFNSDNCHGDDFRYMTLNRMDDAIKFWLFSYDNCYFVRWAIVDKRTNEAIGTIELFHRDSNDFFDNCGLLRLDLRSDYEKRNIIRSILSMIICSVYDLFYCDKIATKVPSSASERAAAVSDLGFTLTDSPLIGDDGTRYYDYFARRIK